MRNWSAIILVGARQSSGAKEITGGSVATAPDTRRFGSSLRAGRFSRTTKHTDEFRSNVYEHIICRLGAEVNEAPQNFTTSRDVVHLSIAFQLDPDGDLFLDNHHLTGPVT